MKIGNFPEIVNDNAARIVAGFVLALILLTIYTESYIPLIFLTYGFLARVLYGPRFEPFAIITLNWVIPTFDVGDKPFPGPPKRFAQMIGLIFAGTSLILFFLGKTTEWKIVLVVLSVFASLESFLGFCAGCFVFNQLMKIGIIPASVCERCNQMQAKI